jgi:restriction endonuclease S subunit
MDNVPLNEPSVFALVSGLWKGERDPLEPACVLGSTNFRGDGLLDFSEIAELLVESRHSSARQLQPGDIIVERSGGGPKQPVGRVAYFDPPDDRIYFTSNFTTALRALDRERFEPRFVELYLHAVYLSGATEPLQRATTGIRNLDWQEYLRFRIPEPPLPQQRAIAEAIGGVRTAYRKEEDLIEVLSGLKRAARRELFTHGLRGEAQKETEIGAVPESWDLTPCEEIFKLTSGKTRPSDLTVNPTEERPFPVLGGNGVMGFSGEWHLDAPRTLIIGRVGEYCGAIHTASGKIWVTDNALYAKEWHSPNADLGFVAAFLEHFDLNRFKRMAGQPLVY